MPAATQAVDRGSGQGPACAPPAAPTVVLSAKAGIQGPRCGGASRGPSSEPKGRDTPRDLASIRVRIRHPTDWRFASSSSLPRPGLTGDAVAFSYTVTTHHDEDLHPADKATSQTHWIPAFATRSRDDTTLKDLISNDAPHYPRSAALLGSYGLSSITVARRGSPKMQISSSWPSVATSGFTIAIASDLPVRQP
jgi:hypothetical protein